MDTKLKKIQCKYCKGHGLIEKISENDTSYCFNCKNTLSRICYLCQNSQEMIKGLWKCCPHCYGEGSIYIPKTSKTSKKNIQQNLELN